MKRVVRTPLPAVAAPLEWAVEAGGMLFTSQVPILADGSVEDGPPERQIELTLDNLRVTLAAAGGDMTDVTQVQVFLTDAAHLPILNSIYRRYFAPPFPNRAVVIAAGLPLPGTVVELVAQAYLCG